MFRKAHFVMGRSTLTNIFEIKQRISTLCRYLTEVLYVKLDHTVFNQTNSRLIKDRNAIWTGKRHENWSSRNSAFGVQ